MFSLDSSVVRIKIESQLTKTNPSLFSPIHPPGHNLPMEDNNRSRSCYYKSYGYATSDMMHMESYNGPPKPLPYSYELRSYSASYSQAQVTNTNRGTSSNRNFKLKKGKSTSGSAYAKSWSFADPDFQRKKRVASYKMYSVEAKVKGTFRKSFRWLKDRYTQVVYGW